MTQIAQRIAFIFPGQGAQYPGMASDFYHQFSAARMTFEEADDILGRNLSSLILNGSEAELMETQNSQVAIYVTSIAIQRVVQELYEITPVICSGLSLGEFTALTVAGWLPFISALPIVQWRGKWMGAACQSFPGTMAVVMGLSFEEVDDLVREVAMPRDLWVANYNCPGQVVISGTVRGIEAAIAAAKAKNAKRILPLQVQGAFHSGLMQEAGDKLAPLIAQAAIVKGKSELVMNVPGSLVAEVDAVRHYLIEQVTHSVRWEQGVKEMERQNIDLYIEFGPGKTLAGMNKRIGVQGRTMTIDKVEDLNFLMENK